MKKTLLIILPFIIAIILSGAASASLSASTTTEKYYTDMSGNTITTANIGDYVYGMVNIVNNQPVSTNGLIETGVTNPALTYQNTYSTSHDNGATWTDNDGSFNFANNAWEYGDMQMGDSYLLRELFQVTGPEPIDLTITDGEMPAAAPMVAPSVNEGPTLQATATEIRTHTKIRPTVKNQPPKSKLMKTPYATLNPTLYAALLRMR